MAMAAVTTVLLEILQIIRDSVNAFFSIKARVMQHKLFVKYRYHIGFLIFAAVCLFFVYAQIGNFGIINSDDIFVINYYRNILKHSFYEYLLTVIAKDNCAVYYFPLSKLSGFLDSMIYGKNVNDVRFTHVMLHLLSSLFLFSFLYYATRAAWRSFFVAALFALHPMNSESIAPLYARGNSLSGVLCMAGLFLYCFYTAKPNIKRYLLVIMLFLLSLLTKPTMMLNVLILPLLDYWPLQRIFAQTDPDACKIGPGTGLGRKWNRLVIVEKLPFICAGAAWLLFTFWYYTQNHGTWLPGAVDAPPSLAARLTALPIACVAYLLKTIFPAGLPYYVSSMFYQGLPVWRSLGAIALLILITGLVLKSARRFPYLVTGWFWFLLILAPHLPVVVSQKTLVIERYGYISLIGLFIVIAWGGADLFQHFKLKKHLAGIITGVFLFAMAFTTWHQTGYFKDAFCFYQHALANFPGSSEVNSRLGELLLNKGQKKEAVEHFYRAIQLDPENPNPHSHLGDFFAAANQPEKAAYHYRQALRIKPDLAAVHNNFANLLVTLGELDKAVHHYRSALKIDPMSYRVYNNLATVLISKGEFEQARKCLEKALAIKPDYQTAQENLKRLEAIKGGFSPAP